MDHVREARLGVLDKLALMVSLRDRILFVIMVVVGLYILVSIGLLWNSLNESRRGYEKMKEHGKASMPKKITSENVWEFVAMAEENYGEF